ncbi:RICIN domain-containing protein [Catellatospora vulcania]|uniref:RICIN domain-containing protein n=1 Tax=Catellatospora vulcania TaxID=1460450 RepID=UPI0012D3C771|nr:RICIN domain-containing protein [Catellatospora vulcania]
MDRTAHGVAGGGRDRDRGVIRRAGAGPGSTCHRGTATTSYLYLGDRWAGAWGGPVGDSQYVWLPIAFPSATTMSLTWYPSITVDAAAGTVTGVAPPCYRVTNRNSGKVVDVVSQSTANNAEIKQWAWNGGGNQRWEFQDAGTGDGADIQQYACGAGNNQQWTRATA